MAGSAALAALCLLTGGSVAWAEAEGVCEPPISTCAEIRIQDSRVADLAPSVYPPPPVCPKGYDCACVPSCPECDDCAARVCVPQVDEPECKTACDCPSGLGCFDGQCIPGFAPVFCCESRTCPSGEQCQHRDGALDRCDDGDTCNARRHRAVRHIARWTAKAGECRRDSDCTLVNTTTGCLGTCGEFINRRHARRFAAKLRRLDERVCDDYIEDGCPYATPGCVAREPACVKGRCVGVDLWSYPLESTPEAVPPALEQP